MKKSVYLLFSLLIMVSIFISSSAKAQTLPCIDGDPITGTCPVSPSSGTTMPINSGVMYLLITGAVVGVMAIKRQKTAIVKA